MSLEEKAADFALKEFEALKKESAEAVAESRTIERNAVIGSVAIWAWAISAKLPQSQYWIVGLLPIALCILGSIRSYALHVRLVRISEYLIGIESKVRNGSVFNWETTLMGKPWTLTRTSIIFWVAVLCINILAAIYF